LSKNVAQTGVMPRLRKPSRLFFAKQPFVAGHFLRTFADAALRCANRNLIQRREDSHAPRHHIERTYGVKYSPSGIKALLHRLGFVDKKPKHVPGKVDPAKQAAFLAEYENSVKTRGKTIRCIVLSPMGISDECVR
jgi:hypothetical protein